MIDALLEVNSVFPNSNLPLPLNTTLFRNMSFICTIKEYSRFRVSPTPVLCILLRTGQRQETDTQTQIETGVAVTAKVNKGLEASRSWESGCKGRYCQGDPTVN